MNAVRYDKLAKAIVIAVALTWGARDAWASTPVSNLTIAPRGDFTELTVVGGGRTLCDHFTEPSGNGRPFRIVLDFCDARHALGQMTFASLPDTRIRRVRTSQFSTSPQDIVRVVLDMRSEVTYTVVPDGADLTVRIVDPSHARFAVWVANPVMAHAQAAPAARKTKPANTAPKIAVAAVTPAPVAAPTEPQPERRTAPLAQSHPEPETYVATPVVVTPPAPADKPKAESKPAPSYRMSHPEPEILARAEVDEPVRPAPAAAAVAVKKSTTPKATKVSKKIEKQNVAPTAAAVTVATTGAVRATGTDPVAADGVTAPPAKPETRIAEVVMPSETPSAAVKPLPLPPVPLVFTGGYTGYVQSPSLRFAEATPEVPISKVSMKPIGPPVPDAAGDDDRTTTAASDKPSPLWASVNSVAMAATAPPETETEDSEQAAGSAVEEALPPKPQTLIDRLKTKFFGANAAPRPYTTLSPEMVTGQDGEVYGPPNPNATISRETLLERIRQAQLAAHAKAGESGVGGVPTREFLYYDDMGRRDPFKQLVMGQRSGFVTDELPNVETLRLVGILRDNTEAIALFENMEGFGYILRAGDKVKNGSLIAIQQNRALFEIDDYGWSHVVALQLTTRGSDPSKALGLNQSRYPSDSEYEYESPSEGANGSRSTGNQGSDN